MDLPEPVTLKFGVYTLACRHFSERLPKFSGATLRDKRVIPVESLASVFNEALASILQRSSPADLSEATSQLARLLRVQIDLFRRSSPNAAAIFDDLVEAMVADAPMWDCEAEVERLHLLGRDLARCYFAGSPYPTTTRRCQFTCRVRLAYGSVRPKDGELLARPPALGYLEAPAAFWPKTGEIAVRFTLKDELKNYMAYPFLFLHEYTAHVFATDHGNALFNDGWMLYVADEFMKRVRSLPNSPIAQMPRRQVNVFTEHLAPLICARSPNAWRGYLVAHGIEPIDRNWFDAITYELAAFVPEPRQRRFWPNEFLNRLESELEGDSIGLRAKLAEATTVQELYAIL